MHYTATHEAVYRGMSIPPANIDQFLADHEPGSIGYWPQFCSSTKSLSVASEFAKVETDKTNKAYQTIMKIYLTSNNNPKTHIDLIHGNIIPGADESDLSFYIGEEEVLLFPYFAYQVLRIEEKYIKEKKTYVKTIVMIELPFQNLLKINKNIE